jgi:hypothetical protein
MQQPTAAIKHSTGSARRTACAFNAISGTRPATKMIAAPIALIARNCAFETGSPNRPNSPPAA